MPISAYPLDPILAHKFIVSVNGVGKLGCRKVSNINEQYEVVEYREGCDPLTKRKQNGLRTFEPVTLERGVTTDTSQFVEWYNQVQDNLENSRKTVIIQVHSPSGAVIRTITLYRAWPSKISFNDLDADGSEIYLEMLEIQYEDLEIKLETGSNTA